MSSNDMDDGSLEVEIDNGEEDLIEQISEEDLVKIQTSLVQDFQELVLEDFKKHQELLKYGQAVCAVQKDMKSDLADEFRHFVKRMRRTLSRNLQMADMNAYKFGITLREVLGLYVEVNTRMKVDEKEAAKQDAFIAQVEKNENEMKELREKLKTLRAKFKLGVVGTVPSKTNLSFEKPDEANHIEKPYKPIETEIATHCARVNREMETLKQQLPTCVHFPKMMDPIQEQGKKVSQMVLKEFPAKPIKQFLDTLPPKQQD